MSNESLNVQELEAGTIQSGAYSHTSLSSNSRRFPHHYRMDRPRRGIAAIFNHSSFEHSVVSERKGSEKDVERLCHTFSRLRFDVETFCDLTFNEIEMALQDLSQRDHSKCDCFVLVFMSHGLEGKLRSRDVVFDVNCLWDCFAPDTAPTLSNKPKIFIVQACQGHGKQCGVRVGEEVVESSREDEKVTFVPGYILPSTPDFLVALSTIPGFVSWRCPQNGSWYIQTLCEHLDRYGFEQDLITLLTHVGREVAVEYSLKDVEDVSITYKKQLPSVISLLTKKVLFTRKNYRACGNSRKRSRMVGSKDKLEDEVNEVEGRKIQKNAPKRSKKKDTKRVS